MKGGAGAPKLRKELGLFDVYAISTGAMFSSGFFLLPGLAAAKTGPSVALAYLVASIFIMPAMFSVAELSTAMPRAGGAYYFLDRSLGPLVGTIGGLGAWVALVLKSAFALVGMGAYLVLYVDVPIKPLAVGLTVVFAAINIAGAKETSGLQRVLVTALISILGVFLIQGIFSVTGRGFGAVTADRFTPFFTSGPGGFLATVGFVFVSYAGLTKVSSVAEEVSDPDRNIPLGMMLSLATAALFYSVGVFILVSVIPAAALHTDLTPVATAAAVLFGWLPEGLGVGLIVVSAVAAFASTGNAGILAASRFPLAMARDRLVPQGLGRLGRFQTPTRSIVITSLVIIASITFLDVEGIAKLASAFLLLLFSLLNLAVVIMRESHIEAYDPGYRTPLYPWMQLFGILAPFWLITEMGPLAVFFTLGLVTLTVGWFFFYARDHVEREGAIFHTFARLGRRRHEGLELELRAIVKEKGLRAEDPFGEVVARSAVLEFHLRVPLTEVVGEAATALENTTGVPARVLADGFLAEARGGFLPVARGAGLPHLRVDGLTRPTLLLVRCAGGVSGVNGTSPLENGDLSGVHALFFLVSPRERPGQHLRLLGHLATQIDDPDFLPRWMDAGSPEELKATLVREERSVTLRVGEGRATAGWVGRPIMSLGLPRGTLVAVVRRGDDSIVPDGSSVLEEGDLLTLIGDADGIREVAEAYAGLAPAGV
jgi:amino acid transporter/mannitol/fructose-specific phosphotransferase system IIA component (Ntr-type)